MNPDDSCPTIPWSLQEPDSVTLAGVRRFERRLKARLLPKLGMFGDFQLLFAQAGALGMNVLGQYVWGSCSKPIVLIDIQTHRDVTLRQRVNFWRLIRVTVVHELGHAIQDWHWRPFNNQEAEYFALGFVEIGVIDRFWERPHPIPSDDDVPFRRWNGESS